MPARAAAMNTLGKTSHPLTIILTRPRPPPLPSSPSSQHRCRARVLNLPEHHRPRGACAHSGDHNGAHSLYFRGDEAGKGIRVSRTHPLPSPHPCLPRGQEVPLSGVAVLTCPVRPSAAFPTPAQFPGAVAVQLPLRNHPLRLRRNVLPNGCVPRACAWHPLRSGQTKQPPRLRHASNAIPALL